MGKTRNNYLVQNHLDEEELTVFDDTDDYAYEYDEHNVDYDEVYREKSQDIVMPTKEEITKDTLIAKHWNGVQNKGIPSLYQIALDALPEKTRMKLSKLVLPKS